MEGVRSIVPGQTSRQPMQAKAKYLVVGLLIIAGVGAGRQLRHKTGVEGFLSAAATPQLDYLAPPESFSRVENAKNELEALCRKLRLQSQSRVFQLRKCSPQQQEHELEAIVTDLKRGMSDFAGTAQQLELAQDLLLLLKSQKDLPQWIDLYLTLAYQHPTDALIGRGAEEAITVGRTVGRENEVLAALKHVAMIPIDFESKARITAALNGNSSREVATQGAWPARASRTGS